MRRRNATLGRWRTFARRWYPCCLSVVCLLPFMPLVMQRNGTIPDFPGGDYASYQVPVREYVREELLEGRFPVWTSLLGAGLPLHAGQQASVCYPFITPLVLLFGAGYGLKISLLLHLFIGFIGMYLLARYHAISRPAASMAAIVTNWSGFNVLHLAAGHVVLMCQFSLVPWFLVALAWCLRAPGPQPAAALAAGTACLAVAGHPQVFIMLFFLAACSR